MLSENFIRDIKALLNGTSLFNAGDRTNACRNYGCDEFWQQYGKRDGYRYETKRGGPNTVSLTIILVVGVILSVIFHFIGTYAGAQKTVWVMIALMWAGSISIAMNEVKPSGYDEVKKMQGEFADTDKLIKEAGDEISLYEFLTIKKSYMTNKPKR